ncbi:UDP-N-acetylmuramoyl-tripeptide--D-alanyl-D-alanine ligase [Fibrella aquatilis]|uniref:UDP-N-acetylmuramoyl-tripeptide--D-alanyl-D-alanine ligase n=1 Tax=Fibrella aquatilis TaxID=2817059 RepID=A0A939GDP7_9BACT|nr:UDP-N-acetylmuramoyl-tripeptide--D-alanyl-D-alanine ligase [Fibrella aquatilis]MBO0934503.1 UDP-N-acetylmuramoyl-tripeptide--D-alanyl-D-alanine ligase [Fibrella aquatilis]
MQLYNAFLACQGISTDTRQITPGCLFVALRGDTFNGNEFALKALADGARYALIDDPAVAEQAPAADRDRCLLVPDALAAMQDLARHHRRQFTFPVVGLTGSNGKTTTKELIAAVLAKKYRVEATAGNLNNHIGVPLTLLRIDPNTTEIAVIEMGANHQQEIAMLSRICEPTHGLITNIGKAHLEGFGGVAGVRKGKGELFDYLAETDGTVFVNQQDATLRDMVAERQLREVVPYWTDGQYAIEQEAPVVIFEDATTDFAAKPRVVTHLPGLYNFANMAAALAIGAYFEVPQTEALQAVADYNPTNNRSQLLTKGTNTIWLDAYNANPSSMAAAVQQFGQQPATRKAVILGDMYELGDESEAEHAALGELVAAQHFDLVILAGHDMKYALSALPKAYYFPDKFSLHNWIADNPMHDTHILIKGSRGMKLETVVPFI